MINIQINLIQSFIQLTYGVVTEAGPLMVSGDLKGMLCSQGVLLSETDMGERLCIVLWEGC